jgi:hypothetical protein
MAATRAGNLAAGVSQAARPPALGASSVTQGVTESLFGAAAGGLVGHTLGFNPAAGAAFGSAGMGTGDRRNDVASSAGRNSQGIGGWQNETTARYPIFEVWSDRDVCTVAEIGNGTFAELVTGADALMPPNYYALTLPRLLRSDRSGLPVARRAEIDKFGAACRTRPELAGMVQTLFDVLLPRGRSQSSGDGSLPELLRRNGFDPELHEQVRSDLKEGRIGLAQNRLPASATVEDVRPEDVARFDLAPPSPECVALGEAALARGEAAVITLAGGAGSRWTQGAGVCKALHPFCKFDGRHRTFIEVHLAKSRRLRTV